MIPVIHWALLGNFLAPFISALILAVLAVLNRPIKEERTARITHTAFLIYLLCAFITAIAWCFLGFKPIKWDLGNLYQSKENHLFVGFYLDKAGILFLCITAIISNVIIFYSRRYLHRDPGYRRFFMVMSVFILGMTFLICAGSFDLLFAGWELVGLSSFLLIGYYWHRPQAVINAKRTYFIYRVCDLGLLISALMSHFLWHYDDLFYKMISGELLHADVHFGLTEQWILSSVILLAVLGKSAQFPLSYWLPRAMEGPTPSSAIFYGSLSIHAGVFLLIRTFSIWYYTDGFTWVVGGIGLTTAILSTSFGRVQANIKGQIGYASIAQVGLMLVELSLGLVDLALVHLCGNAFLRCFQLLISPSILSQQLQIMSALEGKTVKKKIGWRCFISERLESSLYVFALNEGYLEKIIHHYVISPFQKIAGTVNQFNLGTVRNIIVILFVGCLLAYNFIPQVLLLLTLLFSLSALGEKRNMFHILNLSVLSCITAVFSLLIRFPQYQLAVSFYLIGLIVSWMIAQDSLKYILKRRQVFSLQIFSGLFGQFPRASASFLIGILGMMGLPIACTFLGEDILLKYAVLGGWEYWVVFNWVYVLNGIILIRLYCRIFLGVRDAEMREVNLDYSPVQAFVRLGIFIVGNWLAFYLTSMPLS